MIKDLDLTKDETALLGLLCSDHLLDIMPSLESYKKVSDYELESGYRFTTKRININSDSAKKLAGHFGEQITDIISCARIDPKSTESRVKHDQYNQDSQGMGFFTSSQSTDVTLFDHPVTENNFWSLGFGPAEAICSEHTDTKRWYYSGGQEVCEVRMAPEQYVRLMRADTEVAVTVSRGFGLRSLTPPPIDYKPQVTIQSSFGKSVDEAAKGLEQAIDTYKKWADGEKSFASKKKISILKEKLEPVFNEYEKLCLKVGEIHTETVSQLDEEYIKELKQTIMREVKRLPLEAQGKVNLNSISFKS